MHTIEPYWKWREKYTAENDEKSPFYGREYSELEYSTVIYDHYIHPQWDNFGSSTLYLKILFADYEQSFAIIELIGEWNDAVHNDIMFLKRDIMDELIGNGINKFILVGENVLNFHGSDDCLSVAGSRRSLVKNSRLAVYVSSQRQTGYYPYLKQKLGN